VYCLGTWYRFYYETGSRYADLYNAQPWTVSNTPASAAFGYLADYYWFSTVVGNGAVTNCEYEATGTPLVRDQYAFLGNNATPATGASCLATNIQSDIGTNRPSPPWCGDPYYGGTGDTRQSSRGYNVTYGLSDPGIVVYKWDVATNGFKYK
jgi:hypothetical protein